MNLPEFLDFDGDRITFRITPQRDYLIIQDEAEAVFIGVESIDKLIEALNIIKEELK
jgi:hypothetical protein